MNGYGFLNIFKISNLNKDITITSRTTFAYYAIDHRRSEDSDPHAIPRHEDLSFEVVLQHDY